MTRHALFWAGWTGVGLIYELWYIFTNDPTGTLSWQMWGLRGASPRVFSGLFFLLGWALYHFWREGRNPSEGFKSFGFTVLIWILWCLFFTTGDQGSVLPVGGLPPREE